MEDDAYWAHLKRLCAFRKPKMQAAGDGPYLPVGSDDWFQENRPGEFMMYKPGEEELKSYIYGAQDGKQKDK